MTHFLCSKEVGGFIPFRSSPRYVNKDSAQSWPRRVIPNQRSDARSRCDQRCTPGIYSIVICDGILSPMMIGPRFVDCAAPRGYAKKPGEPCASYNRLFYRSQCRLVVLLLQCGIHPSSSKILAETTRHLPARQVGILWSQTLPV